MNIDVQLKGGFYMQKITLKDGTTLEVVAIMGGQRMLNSTNRDTLTFVFDDSHGLAELDALFTSDNCEAVILHSTDPTGQETEYVLEGFTLRAELKLAPEVANDGARVNRISITQAKLTAAEEQAIAYQILMGVKA